MLKKLPVSLLLLVGILSFSVLLQPGFFPMHDDMQAMRVLQMRKCFEDWQFPCRWVPDMGYGYGYPQFHYYPPFPYYLMTLIHLLGFSIIGSVKAGFSLSFVLAGVGMYVLGRKFWGEKGGIISTLFYLFLPYRAVNVYVRGAMGEVWAMAWFPWILWSFEMLVETRKKKYVAFMALSIAGLLTSHSLSTLMIAPFLAIWGIWRVLEHRRELWELLRLSALGAILGVGLAAFYIIPSVMEKSSAHLETLTMGYFGHQAHFVSLRQLFLSTHWGYGSSMEGSWDDLSLQLGVWHWFIPLLSILIGTWYAWRSKFYRNALLLLLAGGFYLFLAHVRSSFIWERIELLSWLQFPWRFLSPASFLFALAAGSIAVWKKNISLLALVVVIAPVILFTYSYMKPSQWIEMNDQMKFSGALWDKQQTISIFDYLPAAASHPPVERAPALPWFVDGEGQVESFELKSDSQRAAVKVNEPGQLRLPLFYFPGWTVFVDNQPVPISYDNELGLITVPLSEGSHTISADFRNTPVRALSNLGTVLSGVVLTILISTGYLDRLLKLHS